MRKIVCVLFGLLFAAGVATGLWAQAVGRRADVERSLKQRYRMTILGPKMLGLVGDRSTIQVAGGVVSVRRAGLSAALNPDQPASYNLRQGAAERVRGSQDFAVPLNEKFYVHSLYVGSDVIVLGLMSARTVSTPAGAGPVWVALNFFLPPTMLAEANLGQIYPVLDQWLLPEEAFRPVVPEPAAVPESAAAPEPAPAPAGPADLKPGMSREDVLALLGPPQREVSFGPRAWLTYAGLVAQFEQGKLVAVDRSGQPPARVKVVSEPDGADVLLDGSFVSSTPAALELPAGSYKVTVRLSGYRDWERALQVLAGSEITLRARLEK